MSLATFIHCSARPGASPSEIHPLILRGLHPVLSALEGNPHFRVHLSVAGNVLEQLDDEVSQRIAALCQRNQLLIVATLFFEPLLVASSAKEIAAQLALSLEHWKSRGVEGIRAVRLQRGWSDHLLQTLSDAELKFVFIPHDVLTDATTGSGFFESPDSKQLIIPYVDCSFRDIQHTNTASLRCLQLQAEFIPDSENEVADFTQAFHSAPTGASYLVTNYSAQANVGVSTIRLEPNKHLRLTELASEVPPKHPAQRFAFFRVAQLAADLARAWELLNTRPHREANEARLKLADKALLQAQSGDFYRSNSSQSYSIRREIFAAVLRAQVEMDFALHPEIDPTHGWVDQQRIDCDCDGEEEIIVDTQLLRLYIEPTASGSVAAFEYKPRKIDLANTLTAEIARPLSFVDALCMLQPQAIKDHQSGPLLRALIPSQISPTEIRVTKHSLDLLGLRFVRKLSCLLPSGSVYEATIVKHLTIKAGIGAHLNNATTGLTIEFWLESHSPPPAGLSLCNQFAFMLPSGDAGGMSLRPLTSVGAALDHVVQFETAKTISAADAPAGLHGTRLIDGIGQFVMDMRTSKPLQAVVLEHLTPERTAYNGSLLYFINDASRIYEDTRSQTIFLSIQ